jgi:hypothetical protein
MPFVTPLSARLKALPCEVECVAQLALRFVCNAFKLHAGMKFFRTVAFGQVPGDDHQRPCTCRINQCSKVGIRLVPRLCPEPKGGEQNRSPFNEVVGRICNEMFGGVRRWPRDVRPNVLLRLFFELNESAHVSAVWHWKIPRGLSPRLCHQIPSDAFAGVALDIHRCGIRPAGKDHRCGIRPVG